MIETDQKIDTLSRIPRQNVEGGKRRARTNLDFYAAKIEKISF